MPEVISTLMANVKSSVRVYNLTAERSAHPLNAPWISPTKDLNSGNRELEQRTHIILKRPSCLHMHTKADNITADHIMVGKYSRAGPVRLRLRRSGSDGSEAFERLRLSENWRGWMAWLSGEIEWRGEQQPTSMTRQLLV
ncbi:unnamed protein product [Sphagnum balticum]